MKIKKWIYNIIFLCFAFSIFIGPYLFLTWPTYKNGSLKAPLELLKYASIFFMLIWCVWVNKVKSYVRLKNVIIITWLIITYFCITLLGIRYKYIISIGNITVLMASIVFFLMSKEDKEKAFTLISRLFILMILPSIIYYIITILFHFHISYRYLIPSNETKLETVKYFFRPFGIIIYETNKGVARPCGIFDEPGYIGTIAGILFPAMLENKSKKNIKWLFLLIFEGVFSMSMAFYLLSFITLIVYAYRKGAFIFIFIMLALIIGFFVFVNISFKSGILKSIQSRIDLNSSTIIKDNRTSITTDIVIRRMFQNKGKDLWFGYGMKAFSQNPLINGSFSVKCLIYDYGLIGTFFYIGTFVVIPVIERNINKYTLAFLLCFLFSIYQRPYVLTFQFFSIFILGLEYISLQHEKNKALIELYCLTMKGELYEQRRAS